MSSHSYVPWQHGCLNPDLPEQRQSEHSRHCQCLLTFCAALQVCRAVHTKVVALSCLDDRYSHSCTLYAR